MLDEKIILAIILIALVIYMYNNGE